MKIFNHMDSLRILEDLPGGVFGACDIPLLVKMPLNEPLDQSLYAVKTSDSAATD